MIRVGIIGAGFGGKIHAPGFRDVPGMQVVGISGRSAEKTEAAAKQNDIPRTFSSWEDLVADPEIDAVSIATPPAFHYEMASLAIKNRKHVFIEKPVAMNAEEAKKLAEEAKAAGVVAMIDYEFRNIPHLAFAKDFLGKDGVGRIRFVHVDWMTGGRAKIVHGTANWQNEKEPGGGTLFGFAPHVIDYLEWIIGPIESVFGKLSVAKYPADQAGAMAEDTCNLLFKFKDGPLAAISISNVMPAGRGHWIEVYGDEGALKIGNGNLKDGIYGFEAWSAKMGDDNSSKCTIPETFGSLAGTYPDGRLEIFTMQARKFAAAIQAGKATEATLEDGLRNQLVLDAIRKSNESGAWQTVTR